MWNSLKDFRRRLRGGVSGYVLAIVAIAVAALLRYALGGVLGHGLAYVTFYPAVMFVAMLGGFGPGVLATLLAALFAHYLFLPAGGYSRYLDTPDAVGLGLFTGMGVAISFCTGLCHKAQDKVIALERKAALRESEARMSGIISSAMDAIISINTEQRIVLFNPAAEKLFGISAKEAVGQSINRFIPERFRAAHAQHVEDFVRTRPSGSGMGVLGPLSALRASGEEFSLEATVSQAEVGGQKLLTIILRDVTARMQAEETLRASEERLRLAVEAAELGTWDHDLRNHRLAWSDRTHAMFGVPPGTPVSWELILSHVHPEDRERFLQGVEKSLDPNGPGRFEVDYRSRWPDGTVRWLSSIGQSLFEGEGAARQIVRRIGIIRDVTERRDREQELAAIYEQAPLIMLLVDGQCRLRKVNRFAENFTGTSAADLLNRQGGGALRCLLMLDVPEGCGFGSLCQQCPVRRTIRDTLETGHSHQQVEATLPFPVQGKPQEVTFLLSTAPLDVRGQRMVLVTMQDISERKRMERELRESEQRYHTLIDAMPQLVYTCSPDGFCDYASRPWLEYTGASREEVLGLGWMKFLHPEDRPRLQQVWEHAVATGAPYAAEFRFRNARGEYRWLLTRGVPMKDAEGRVLKWFGTNTDITDLVMAREAQARSRAELDRLVQERTAKLRQAVAELEHFSYAIVHDMRAPLRAINSFAQIVEKACVCPQEPRCQDYLRRIQIASTRMDQLITDSLSYSKAVRQELPIRPVDLSKLVHELINTYPNLQPDKADIQFEGDLPTVLGNEAALTQCFSNLLGNAVKFVAPGTRPRVRVWAETVQSPEPTVHGPQSTASSIQHPVSSIRIWIEDNGIGIPKDAQPRIFDMFQRFTNAYEGTGIGLAVVRKVTERMGGRVGVESEPGKGSRFWIELPRE